MIDAELRSPVVQAVMELVAARTADEQARILKTRAGLFRGWGADGALAAMCMLGHQDLDFIARLEQIRISFNDVRRNRLPAAQVEGAIRPFLPFGGLGAPTVSAGEDRHDVGEQIAAIVSAYLTAGAWRVRHGRAWRR